MPLSPEETRQIVTHELGHYFCAKAFGYQAAIVIDRTNEEFQTACSTEEEPDSEAERIKFLERKLIFTLGGHALEKLCGEDPHMGLIDDYMQAFGTIAELYMLTDGNPLEDVAVLIKQQDQFLEKSMAILEGIGTPEEFEAQVEYFIQHMEESPLYEHVFYQESDSSFVESAITITPPEAGEMHVFDSVLNLS